MKNLLDQKQLLATDVVANNLMNRERGCVGGNSYQRDLVFNPVEFLQKRLAAGREVSWLDICCGRGRALIEAAGILSGEDTSNDLQITGIDLAGGFDEFPAKLESLRLLETAVEDFTSRGEFDLITCVHGLHYIGDKLGVLQKSAAWLKPDGVLVANLDVKSLKLLGSKSSSRIFSGCLRKQGFTINASQHLISLAGKTRFEMDFEYAGADHRAGANYTGQPAVDSYYRQ